MTGHRPRPSNTAPEARQACSVSAGKGSLLTSSAAPPTGLRVMHELVAKNFSDRFQNADGFVGNFRSDTVARKGGEVEEHGALLYGGRAREETLSS